MRGLGIHSGGRRYEAVVPASLEDVAARELRERLGRRAAANGDVRPLLDLRTVLAVYEVLRFDVPRPRALPGDEHLRRLSAAIGDITKHWPAGTFARLRIDAAGSDSAILLRLADELAHRTGLRHTGPHADRSDGRELCLRLRRTPIVGADARTRARSDAWEALIRLSPRPLSARPWRVCDMPGALNAVVAHAMVRLAGPSSTEVVLNLSCGSATLAIERLAWGPAKRIIACDARQAALDCAAANVTAAGLTERIELRHWDARHTPLPDDSVDTVLADLPFGHRIKTADPLTHLYTGFLQEASRVPGADVSSSPTPAAPWTTPSTPAAHGPRPKPAASHSPTSSHGSTSYAVLTRTKRRQGKAGATWAPAFPQRRRAGGTFA